MLLPPGSVLVYHVEPLLAEKARERQGKRTDLEDFPAKRPEGSERHDHEAREQAAKMMGVGGRTVQRAKAVKQADPEAHERIKRGESKVNTEYDRLPKKRPSVQVPDKAEGGRPDPTRPFGAKRHQGSERAPKAAAEQAAAPG